MAQVFPSIAQRHVNDSSFKRTEIERFIDQPFQFNPQTPYVTFIFLSPECPLCKNYSATLNSLNKKFGSQVTLIGIIPGRTYSGEDIQTYKSTYNIEFPVIVDSAKKISNYLHATTTPEVILLSNYQLIYRGAIDDWVISLGKMQVSAKNNFLSDAITSTLAGKEVAVKRTKPVGCRINDY